jgi:uncharacterized SAM-binding protein YcdF (DUF218 family)
MRKGLVWAAAAILAVAAYREAPPLLQAAGDYLAVSDPVVPVDAIVAIGGDGRERIDTAMQLLRRGMGRWLVISGGPYDRGQNSATAMREQAVSEGMAAGRMLVDDRAESTYDNATGTARLMQSRGLRTALVLTAPYHTRRASVVFHRVFRPEGLEVRMLAVDDGYFNVHGWWTRVRDRLLVFREYVKLMAFFGGLR